MNGCSWLVAAYRCAATPSSLTGTRWTCSATFSPRCTFKSCAPTKPTSRRKKKTVLFPAIPQTLAPPHAFEPRPASRLTLHPRTPRCLCAGGKGTSSAYRSVAIVRLYPVPDPAGAYSVLDACLFAMPRRTNIVTSFMTTATGLSNQGARTHCAPKHAAHALTLPRSWPPLPAVSDFEARSAEVIRTMDRLVAYLDVSTCPGALIFREGG